MATYNRFRERRPSESLNFLGNSKGKKLKAGDQIGTVREYTSSGSLLSTSIRRLTGTPKDSLSIERTWDEVHPGPPYKSGGDFANVKIRLPSAQVVGSGTYTSQGNPAYSWPARLEYTGGFMQPSFAVSQDGVSYDDYLIAGARSPWAISQFPDLSPYFTKAWDRIRPSVEKAGLSQFLYELRDLPGMLETTARGFKKSWESIQRNGNYIGDIAIRRNPALFTARFVAREDRPWMLPKEAADHFLNHNFGWVPFIGDLMKFLDVYENSAKYIDDAIRNNGFWVRRKREVEHIESDTVIENRYTYDADPVLAGNWPGLFKLQTIDGLTCAGTSQTRLREVQRIWAEGVFTQYRPEFDPNLSDFDSEINNLRRLLTLYGFRINPSVLWKITPWSWLVDWFTGIGRNIEIATQNYQDSIAAKYAYIMSMKTRQVVKHSTAFFWSGTVNFTCVRELLMKQRQGMLSPYGFNLDWSNLSSKQLAILGSLGLSRIKP